MPLFNVMTTEYVIDPRTSLYNVRFKPLTSIFAPTAEEAMTIAKNSGVKLPVLEQCEFIGTKSVMG